MTSVSESQVSLNESVFMRQLIRHLSGSLQDVVGMEDAEGFISLVGQRMGDELNEAYRSALSVGKLSAQEVGEVLVDLKRRINGEFYIIEENDEKIVLGNSRCPFGEMVKDRPSLCMMTSNVFGAVAADNLGYAKVELQETIARGHNGCRVVVYLKESEEARASEGREYFNPDLDPDT